MHFSKHAIAFSVVGVKFKLNLSSEMIFNQKIVSFDYQRLRFSSAYYNQNLKTFENFLKSWDFV